MLARWYTDCMVVTVTVRMPETLHGELVRMADEEHRSLNRQIVHMLSKRVVRE